MASNYNRDLIRAATRGDVAGVENALDNGANINTREDDNTALNYAVANGHTGVVEKLIERGADVNAKSEESSLPIGDAIFKINQKINESKPVELQSYLNILTALKPCYERNINMNFLRNAVTVAAIYGISSYFGNTRQAHACTFFAAFAIDSVFGMGVKNRAMHPSETFVYASALAASSITASMLVKNNVLKAVITILPAVAKNLYDEGSYYKQIIDIEKKLADYNTKNPERTVNY
jgi:hypothetical protein